MLNNTRIHLKISVQGLNSSLNTIEITNYPAVTYCLYRKNNPGRVR